MKSDVHEKLLNGLDWRFQPDWSKIRECVKKNPGFSTLFLEMLAYLPQEVSANHACPNIGISAARWGNVISGWAPVRWLRRATRILNCAVRDVLHQVPWLPVPVRRVHVLGAVSIDCDKDTVKFEKLPTPPNPDGWIVVVATHNPTVTEVEVAVNRARWGCEPIQLEDPTNGNDPNVLPKIFRKSPSERDLGELVDFSILDYKNQDAVLFMNDFWRTRHAARKILIDGINGWLREKTGEQGSEDNDKLIETLQSIRFRYSSKSLVKWADFRLRRFLLSRKLRNKPSAEPLDRYLEEASVLVLRNISFLEWQGDQNGYWPAFLSRPVLHQVSSEHLTSLLLAHHVLDGPAARMYLDVISQPDRVLVQEWPASAPSVSFGDCALATQSYGCLVGVRKSCKEKGQILGPWMFDGKGRVVETEIDSGDQLYFLDQDQN